MNVRSGAIPLWIGFVLILSGSVGAASSAEDAGAGSRVSLADSLQRIATSDTTRPLEDRITLLKGAIKFGGRRAKALHALGISVKEPSGC